MYKNEFCLIRSYSINSITLHLIIVFIQATGLYTKYISGLKENNLLDFVFLRNFQMNFGVHIKKNLDSCSFSVPFNLLLRSFNLKSSEICCWIRHTFFFSSFIKHLSGFKLVRSMHEVREDDLFYSSFCLVAKRCLRPSKERGV